MTVWRVRTLVSVGLLIVLFGGCGSVDHPYNQLSSEQMQYVIPGSENWSSGELCPDGGDCSGAITVEGIEWLDWYRVDEIDFPRDPNNVPRSYSTSVIAGVSAIAYPTARSVRESLSLQVGKRAADAVSDVLDEGYAVIVGVEPAPTPNRARVFAAFDAEGRVGGVGHAMAQYFTIPVAELAAGAGAPSAFEYLEPILSS